jgi:hypothetical protein
MSYRAVNQPQREILSHAADLTPGLYANDNRNPRLPEWELRRTSRAYTIVSESSRSWLWRTNKGGDRLKIGLVVVRGVHIESRCVEADRLE